MLNYQIKYLNFFKLINIQFTVFINIFLKIFKEEIINKSIFKHILIKII